MHSAATRVQVVLTRCLFPFDFAAQVSSSDEEIYDFESAHNVVSAAISLRACYAMSGTDVA
eukprot:1218990-Rhodomonas_salina.1